MVTVQVGKDGCSLGSEDMQQRKLTAFEEGDVKSRIAGSGGGFQTDPAGADDDHLFRPSELDLDALTVFDTTQVVHAVEIGAWNAQATWCRTRREQQLVEEQPGPGGGGDGSCPRVQ